MKTSKQQRQIKKRSNNIHVRSETSDAVHHQIRSMFDETLVWSCSSNQWNQWFVLLNPGCERSHQVWTEQNQNTVQVSIQIKDSSDFTFSCSLKTGCSDVEVFLILYYIVINDMKLNQIISSYIILYVKMEWKWKGRRKKHWARVCIQQLFTSSVTLFIWLITQRKFLYAHRQDVDIVSDRERELLVP